MRPFIYNFLELSGEDTKIDAKELLEYSTELNLTVLKGTNYPAIEYREMGTQTFTKAGQEPSDSDQNNFSLKSSQLITGTQTRHMIEGGDSDYNKSILSLMETKTVTLSHEGVDSDQNNQIRLLIKHDSPAV